uniref:Uncharacterized protein n=1 Tax=Timema poppense TaxID=170557 RepID=A0A7R9HGP9_TIMPO|nr:unnamed protein product [Timema poppensis]
MCMSFLYFLLGRKTKELCENEGRYEETKQECVEYWSVARMYACGLDSDLETLDLTSLRADSDISPYNVGQI